MAKNAVQNQNFKQKVLQKCPFFARKKLKKKEKIYLGGGFRAYSAQKKNVDF